MSAQIISKLPIIVLGALMHLVLIVFCFEAPELPLILLLVLALMLLPLCLSSWLGDSASIVIATTTVYGGLGMLLGGLIDQHSVGHAHHHVMSFTSLLSWSNGLMLGFCMLFCWWLCPAKRSVYCQTVFHFSCTLGMFIGMLLAAHAYRQLWHSVVDPPMMHLVMLLGMLLGVSLVELIGLLINLLSNENQNTAVSH